MRPLSATLCDLVVIAEAAIMRPGGIDRGNYADVRAEVTRADASPAEGERATSAAVIVVVALERYWYAAAADRQAWLMVIGTVLPLLRADAYRAIRAERGVID